MDQPNWGEPEQETMRRMQEQGASPREVNDALNRAQIKRERF